MSEGTPVTSTTEQALNRLRVEIARMEVKLDTALSFRQDLRREFEEHKRYVERDMLKILNEIMSLETKLESEMKEIDVRTRGLELSDNTHDNYFRSIGFVRDAIFALLMALIGAGVFLK